MKISLEDRRHIIASAMRRAEKIMSKRGEPAKGDDYAQQSLSPPPNPAAYAPETERGSQSAL